MTAVQSLHERLVHGRRVERLARLLAPLLPPNSTVLDVGCGDGRLGAALARERTDLAVTGLDVQVRPRVHIPVSGFDGVTIPLADGSVDTVLFVDVLHHTVDPVRLLKEARRVARTRVVIKDHLRQGLMAGPTLRLMDWVGNAGHGVALPYNYWTAAQWRSGLADAGLAVVDWRTDLRLYPAAAGWLFDRSLHFMAALEPAAATRTESPARAGARPTS